MITPKYSFDTHSMTIRYCCCVHFHDLFLTEPIQIVSIVLTKPMAPPYQIPFKEKKYRKMNKNKTSIQ